MQPPAIREIIPIVENETPPRMQASLRMNQSKHYLMVWLLIARGYFYIARCDQVTGDRGVE